MDKTGTKIKTAATEQSNEQRTETNMTTPQNSIHIGDQLTPTHVVSSFHMRPLDKIGNFDVRPGIFTVPGATAVPAGGVNFTIQSHGATSIELLLFHRKAPEPYAILKFPENYRIGMVYSMMVFGLNIEEFEYAYRVDGPFNAEKGLLFNKEHILIDPYAKAITNQSEWGSFNDYPSGLRARVVRNNFDWELIGQTTTPIEDLIIYEAHVRGFTMSPTSGVKHSGTFKGLYEKIPYLKALGINAVELMPIFEFDEMLGVRIHDYEQLIDYWGYNTIGFFAPNTSYTSSVEYNREGTELKELIKALHENGIDVILDVVFNHTAEGNENGPFISFKGLDNNIYYMLTPEGFYYNFSGCGNTLNCNHPIVQQLILDCLRYWVTDYRIDGFRFDLATILGRSDDGSPLNSPPLLRSLAFDPILGNVKLIAEAWDAGGLYQVGSFPSWKRWAEWNGKYRDDMRSFLKGDKGYARIAMQRIMGSPDLYDPILRGVNASINFITCHDGFTLYDLYSYNEKHNEANGWNNTDGSNDNRSWNCGVEGETDRDEILSLRKRMMMNAVAVLMCSRGTPMFLSGDEFGDTRFGNNNPYCQDNPISWMDWTLLEKNKDLYEFFRYMITFRKSHPVLRHNLPSMRPGLPVLSEHGIEPFKPDYGYDSHLIGVMMTGYDHGKEKEDIVYIIVNAGERGQVVTLPHLPLSAHWNVMVNTGDPRKQTYAHGEMLYKEETIYVGERSVIVFSI